MATERAQKITDRIYQAYGSHSGFLFGLPPSLQSIVPGIVEATLRVLEEWGQLKEESPAPKNEADKT